MPELTNAATQTWKILPLATITLTLWYTWIREKAIQKYTKTIIKRKYLSYKGCSSLKRVRDVECYNVGDIYRNFLHSSSELQQEHEDED